MPGMLGKKGQYQFYLQYITLVQGRRKMIKVRGARRRAPMVQAARNFFQLCHFFCILGSDLPRIL